MASTFSNLLNFNGFETGDEAETAPGLLQGTASIQTGTVRTGTYALRSNPTTTATGAYYFDIPGTNGTNEAPNQANVYIQFAFRYATKPSSNNEQIFETQSVSGEKASIRINSSGNLLLYAGTATLVATGSTALSANTWYELWIKLGSNVGGAYELKIDGVSEFSGTTTFNGNNTNQIGLGKASNKNGNTVDFFYDDVVYTDATFPAQDWRVKMAIPIANGSTMTWTSGTNTSDYTQVNTVPVDTTKYIMSPTTGNPNTAYMDMQTASTLGVTGTIGGVKVMIDTRENTSVTSATSVGINSGGSAGFSSTRNGTTSQTWQMIVFYTDPNTANLDWTTTAFDAAEAGAKEANAVSVRCSAVYLGVLYSPATTSIKTVNGLAVASVKTVEGLAIASVKNINGLA